MGLAGVDPAIMGYGPVPASKKALKKDIPVAVMFRYLTIHSFTEYLKEQESGESNSKEKIDPSEERKRGKDRLKARISRR